MRQHIQAPWLDERDVSVGMSVLGWEAMPHLCFPASLLIRGGLTIWKLWHFPRAQGQ
ncbi:unnamed protein product [Staurois parvus]|uniref:Uncharacterized protein n=1 Tax=Staurois parvus TaxID=386267 RepID=A0ABN9D6X7_9NEOB|nr:unnamed protein product [Staurois parvus]